MRKSFILFTFIEIERSEFVCSHGNGRNEVFDDSDWQIYQHHGA